MGDGAAAGMEACNAFIAADLAFGDTNPGTALPAWAVAAIAEAIYGIADLFGLDLFGGGHPYIPPIIRWEIKHPGGRPAAQGATTGQYPEWAPGQEPLAGRIMLVGVNDCGGEWVNTKSRDSLVICSPNYGCATLGCLCYWGCRECDGSFDLYSGDVESGNGPTTRGIPLGNGGCSCLNYPGPQQGCQKNNPPGPGIWRRRNP